MSNKEKFTFFWKGPLSQWSRSPFKAGGITYQNAEMYMMYYKDKYFSGGKLADQILAAKTPDIVKDLGRQVENFNDEEWCKIAKAIVFTGNYLKFSQNEKHRQALLATSGTTLVEASPYDTRWGIGLTEDDPRAQSRETWLGENWLGEVLTSVREVLKIKESYETQYGNL